MHQLSTVALTILAAITTQTPDAGDFVLHDSNGAKSAHGAKPSTLEATKTHAAMRLFVIDKDKGPIPGIVICLTSPAGVKRCTEETDADGYAEVLVPTGQKYDIAYLSLGRTDVAASVNVTDEPKQNIKLTLRYKPRPPAPPFELTGIEFDTARATLRPGSTGKLDVVYEFLRLKRHAEVQISGHTDNVGKPKANKTLSEQRAQACRAYLMAKGIDGARIKTAGFGDERPIAPNDTDEGRQKNRRIEVVELRAASPP